MVEVTDKIKKLLESPVPEDIAIGLKILIKQEKIKTQEHLKKLLTGIDFRPNEDLDIYVDVFNIRIYDEGFGDRFNIYDFDVQESKGKVKLLRV